MNSLRIMALMRYLAFPFSFVLLLLCSMGALNAQGINADAAADQLIRRIEARYGRMRGLAAEFEQIYSAPGVREVKDK